MANLQRNPPIQLEPDSPVRNSTFPRNFRCSGVRDQRIQVARAAASPRPLTSLALVRQPTLKEQTVITSDEKMHVIRHNHVSAYGDVKVENSDPRIIFDRTLRKVYRGNLGAIARAERNKEKRRTEINKIKTMRTVFDHLSDCRGSRVGCNSPIHARDTRAATADAQPAGLRTT